MTAGLLWALAFETVGGCSGPQASGTKTNWFMTCDSSLQCGEEGSCICGLCTVPCSEGDECGGGECGSQLATVDQCESFLSTESQICLPAEQVDEQTDASGCTTLALEVGGALGETSEATCSAPGALLCESFDGPFSQPYSTWQQPGGNAWLTDCAPYSGLAALHMTSQDSGNTQVRMRLPEPRAAGPLHARFFLQLKDTANLPEQSILFEFWDREDGADGGQTSTILTNDGRLFAFVAPAQQSITATAMEPLQPDRWYCIEIEDVIDDLAGSFTVSVDGAPVIEGTNLDTLPENPIAVAVIEAQPQTGSMGTNLDVLVDDLVIASEPIGCD